MLNLNKMQLKFILRTAAVSTAGGQTRANAVTSLNELAKQCLPTDYCSLFSRIRLTSASSNEAMVELYDADIISKMVNPLYLNHEKRSANAVFVRNSSQRNALSGNNAFTGGFVAGDFPENSVGTVKIREVQGSRDFPYSKLAANRGRTNFDEQSYFQVLNNKATVIAGTTDVATDWVIQLSSEVEICVDLGKLLHTTIFGINKSIFYPSSLKLELTFNPARDMIFQFATAETGVGEVKAIAAPSITIADMRIEYPQEADYNLRNMLINSTQAYNLVLPYIYQSQQQANQTGVIQNNYYLPKSSAVRLLAFVGGLMKRDGTDQTFIRANSYNQFLEGGSDQKYKSFELRDNNKVLLRLEKANDLSPYMRHFLDGTDSSLCKTEQQIENYGCVYMPFDTDQRKIFDFSENCMKGMMLHDMDHYLNAQFNATTADGKNVYENYGVYITLRNVLVSNKGFQFM